MAHLEHYNTIKTNPGIVTSGKLCLISTLYEQISSIGQTSCLNYETFLLKDTIPSTTSQNQFNRASVMSSKIFLLILVSTLVKADIATGKCPTVSGTKFNCTEVLHNFYHIERRFEWETQIYLLIYGFLPSSRETPSLNAFAFNLSNVLGISDYYAILTCGKEKGKKDILKFHCDYDVPMRPMHQ